MQTIKISQSVVTTANVEMEITVPCYRKDKSKYCTEAVAILSERRFIKVFISDNNYVNILNRTEGNLAEYFTKNYEETTVEYFNEVFKKAINILSQSATHFATDFIIHVEPLPVEEIK